MASTSPITSTALGATPTPRLPKSVLDKDAFLQLFVEQLRHQDPTKPQDLSEQMAQVSQMSMVEQLTTLTASMAQLTKSTSASHAQALLGRTVTYRDAEGQQVSGTVERVDLSGDAPTLTVGGVGGIDPQTLVTVS
ncbi:MAG TPA: flagellar hook capping FlgD N-terminal domain-containing protein [Baekduia sp.]|nr:flagellar hook capping FlgD N-terminal domain-containing protein [Baekduia sp.]